VGFAGGLGFAYNQVFIMPNARRLQTFHLARAMGDLRSPVLCDGDCLCRSQRFSRCWRRRWRESCISTAPSMGMTGAFQAGYAIAMLVAGRLTDRLGTRKAFALAIVFWSLAAMTPGAATSPATLGSRCSCWGWARRPTFRPATRPLPSGFPGESVPGDMALFNTGANLGSMTAPLIVPGWYWFGWRVRPSSPPERRASFGCFLG